MSMMGMLEMWPRDVKMHYSRHLAAGTIIVALWPRKTYEQRVYRMKRHLHFYQRLLRHIVKMHPEVSTDPWLKKIIGAPGSGEG